MSDENLKLGASIENGLGCLGAAIFVPLIGFLGIQFVQMGGNWWWAGMVLFGMGVLALYTVMAGK